MSEPRSMTSIDEISVLKAWKGALTSGDPDHVVALYDDNAGLKGTLRDAWVYGHSAIREYFADDLFAGGKNSITVSFDDIRQRQLDAHHVQYTGSYVFTKTANGESVEIPATFLFSVNTTTQRITEHMSCKCN